jgi:hypothetical protein
MVIIAGNVQKCAKHLIRKKSTECASCEHGIRFRKDCRDGMDYPLITLRSMGASE